MEIPDKEFAMRHVFVFLSLICILASSCSTMSVVCREAPNANLGSFKTYNFYPLSDRDNNPGLFTGESRDMIQNAIQHEMEVRGYTESQQPDLRIALFMKVMEKPQIRKSYYGGSTYYGRYFGYDYYGLYQGIQVPDYVQGTLIVDIVDNARKRLLWQGVVEKEFLQDDMPGEDGVNKAIGKLFEQYPVRPVSINQK